MVISGRIQWMLDDRKFEWLFMMDFITVLIWFPSGEFSVTSHRSDVFSWKGQQIWMQIVRTDFGLPIWRKRVLIFEPFCEHLSCHTPYQPINLHAGTKSGWCLTPAPHSFTHVLANICFYCQRRFINNQRRRELFGYILDHLRWQVDQPMLSASVETFYEARGRDVLAEWKGGFLQSFGVAKHWGKTKAFGWSVMGLIFDGIHLYTEYKKSKKIDTYNCQSTDIAMDNMIMYILQHTHIHIYIYIYTGFSQFGNLVVSFFPCVSPWKKISRNLDRRASASTQRLLVCPNSSASLKKLEHG